MVNRIDSKTPVWKKGLTRSLLSLAVLTALGTNFGVAQAQEASADTDESSKAATKEQVTEVIEVRGIRASQAENLAVKRLAGAVVDAITAEDIGKFPDKNVADSLQRVPGVVISRSGGEGASVSIRGLSSELTFTQLNGNFIASSPGEPSRSFDYALLPSAMISKVEVYKSSEARLDEGGVGGTVLLHTRKPLEMDSGSGVLNIESTYADVTDDYEPHITGVYSWKNAAESFGILFGYTKQDRTNRTLTGSTSDWRWTSQTIKPVDVNGNIVPNNNLIGPIVDATGNKYEGYWVPQVVRAGVTNEKREREGIQITPQWRLTDKLEVGINYFGFTLGQDMTLSVLDMPEWSLNPNFVTHMNTDPSKSVITGIDYSAGAAGAQNDMQFPWIRGTYVKEESTSDTYDFNLKYEGDAFTARVVFGHTKAKGGPSESWEAAYKSSNWGEGDKFVENAAQYAGWNMAGDTINMYMDPAIITNLMAGVGGGRDPGSSNSSFVRSTLAETYGQVDLDFNVDFSVFTMIRAGYKYRNGELHRETGNNFFLAKDFDIEGALTSGRGINVFDSYQWNGGMPAANKVINTSSEGNIPGGFNINVMPTINWNAYRDMITSNYQLYTRIEDNFVYDITEVINAGYLQGDFEYSSLRGNVGARVVRTETTGASTDLYTYFLDHTDDVTGLPVTGNKRFIEKYDLISQTKTDTKVLPSFNIAWDASDNLVVRGAVAKVMSRPGYGALGSQERISFVSDEWAEDRASFNELPGFRGSGGNKNLKPYESVQSDLSLEYYYGKGSAVGIAFFNKDVDNFVVPLIISSTRDFAGQPGVVPAGPITVNPYSTSGNGSNANSKGVEVFIQHAFENGFGINANYTHNKTNQANVSVQGEKVGESPLVGSADYQYNLSAYYENDDYSLRASYNKRGEVVGGLASGLNIFSDPYDQVDLNASYSVTETLVATAAVVNLTESESVQRLGNDTDARFLSSSYSGRRFYLGLNYKF